MVQDDYSLYMSPEKLEAEVQNHARWQHLMSFLQDAKNVLDVGAGSGHLGMLLKKERPGLAYLAVDCRPENVHYMHQQGLMAEVGLAEALDFPDQSFDIVVLAEVLEHLKNPGKALSEAFRVGKRVLLSLPKNHTDEWHQHVITWEQSDNGIVMFWRPNK